MTDGPMPGRNEAKALLNALSDYFINGTDVISYEVITKIGWKMKVTAEVVQRPKEAKE